MNRKLKLQELNRDSIAEFKSKEKHDVIVILDNLRSLNNIGSFFRTSDAFNIRQLILTGICAQPPHRDIQKTALGATQSVDWKYIEDSVEAVKECQKAGFKTYAIEQAVDVISFENFEVEGPIAVVFGNEVEGVRDEVIQICDGVIELPQFGTKHSLNVSVCGGAVLWEITKQIIKKAEA